MGRLVDDKQMGLFPDGEHKFHLELRCKNDAFDDLCDKCENRTREPCNGHKSHPALLHGLMNEPIPYWSHVYGGPWYEIRVPKWGEPVEEQMVKAKKASEEAMKGVTPSSVKTVVSRRKKPMKIIDDAEPVEVKAIESVELPLRDVEFVRIQVRRVGDHLVDINTNVKYSLSHQRLPADGEVDSKE